MSGSTVRFPEDVLGRAEQLDPENRSRVLREAAERGLELMERDRIVDEAQYTRDLVRKMLLEDDALGVRVGEILDARTKGPRRRVSVIPMFSPSAAPMSQHTLDGEEGVTLHFETEQASWMVYRPVGLKIWHTGDAYDIEVSELREDDGNGCNLLMPGWHSAAEINGLGSSVVRPVEISAPSTLSLTMRVKSKMAVSVGLVVEIVRDVMGAPRDAWKMAQVPAVDVDSGRLVRIPFEKQSGEMEWATAPVNWGTLRVIRPLFEPGPICRDEEFIQTQFRELRVGGSPVMLPTQNWMTVAAYGPDESPDIRLNHMLISPNCAYMDLQRMDSSGRDVGVVQGFRASLLCEVVRPNP